MSVILTGDAENSVFHRIAAENTSFDFRSKLGLLNPLHTVLLMLPHHGSLKNRSGSMLRFFTPNVFGISAGDGRQHGHPSAELIQEIHNIYSRSFSHLSETFYRQYEYKGKFHFISLNNEGRHTIDKVEPGRFLCPNIYGCIKWDQEGIRTNFNNSIKLDDGEKYSVLYATHALETDRDIGASEAGMQISTISPDDDSITTLTLMKLPEEFPYQYLAENPTTEELFVGVSVVDPGEKKTTKPSRVYFYKLLAAE